MVISSKLKISLAIIIVISLPAILYREHSSSNIHVSNAYITGQLIKVRANTDGIIGKVPITRGSFVEQGDLLLSLQKDQALIQLKQSEAEYERSVRNYLGRCIQAEILKKEVEKSVLSSDTNTIKKKSRETLTKNNVLSKDDYVNYETAAGLALLDMHKKQLEQKILAIDIRPSVLKDNDVQSHRLELEDAFYNLSLHDSFALQQAFVYDVLVYEGTKVNEGDLIAVLVPQDKLLIQANVLEDVVANISPGQPVDIYVEALSLQGDKPLTGFVHSIVPATASVFSPIPANNMDSTWVKVRQRVPVLIEFSIPPSLSKTHMPLGASVELVINTKDRVKASALKGNTPVMDQEFSSWQNAFEERSADILSNVQKDTYSILNETNS